MKRYRVQIKLPDDFEPCVIGCEESCPFGYFVEGLGEGLGEYICDENYSRGGEFYCPVKLGQCIDD